MPPNKRRCPWCVGDEAYENYHDTEWGIPIKSNGALFEMLNLEGAQAGLSWITVLRKREGYRKSFDDFNPEAIANYSDEYLEGLRQNPDIIRNKLKIYAVRSNALAFLKMKDSGIDFSTYLWDFVDGKPIINNYDDLNQVPAQTEISQKMSKDLKKRGFKFVGPTIVYAFMQAAGLVNDHLTYCFRHDELS